jgi:hypothetical protein
MNKELAKRIGFAILSFGGMCLISFAIINIASRF